MPSNVIRQKGQAHLFPSEIGWLRASNQFAEVIWPRRSAMRPAWRRRFCRITMEVKSRIKGVVIVNVLCIMASAVVKSPVHLTSTMGVMAGAMKTMTQHNSEEMLIQSLLYFTKQDSYPSAKEKGKMRFLICSSLTLLACVCSGAEKETLWHPSQDAAWELTFEDNFEDSELDESKWFPGYRLGRVEYYKRIGYPNAHTRDWQPNPPLAHFVIKEGALNLRVERHLPKRDKPTSMTVSALTSAIYRYDEATKEFKDNVKFSQKYGWWEMRCRMPVCGSGAYTAFWLHSVGARNQEYSPEGVRHGNPAGKSPALEIDIFEWVGRSPHKNLFNVHFTKNGSKAFDCPCDLTTEFHTWAINWEEGRITWYLDGRPVHVYEGPTPEGKMYLLMAMFQIGGWVGEVDENLPYPLDFEVDYVKVWKKR